ncbi:hypothetical protein BDV93DRAFT_519198 [Ceratobasidium sp. AG-I]|nr:hypothetical protein BDV93DRAFT_519198 [Ceratobasidium sp. AG-I]
MTICAASTIRFILITSEHLSLEQFVAMQYSRGVVALRLCQAWVNLRVVLTALILLCASVEASPILVSRAIVRPIPMPGFNVSVFDDTTGAPIPQVQASDGGGLINGRVYSAPNIIWAIAAIVIGFPLSVAGVKLWRITTALGGGLSFAFAMWAAIINTVSEAGLASSQSMSDMLILLITGAAFLVGGVGGAFRIAVLPAIGATGAIGGASIMTRAVILRPGLLVPPGLNQQLAFVDIILVALGVLAGGLSVIFNQRGSIIFATSSAGSFLIALAIDLLLNGQRGMSRGLRFLFDMNANHLADLAGGGYSPPLSSQIIIGASLGLIPVFCLFQHFVFPGPFLQPRPRDRTQSQYSNLPDEKQSSSLASKASPTSVAPGAAPGPAWRTSVLSLFRVPGRSSSNLGPGSGQLSTNPTGLGAPGGGRLDGPFKPSNERRGSAAYNFGQGVFALPSELMRQQTQRSLQTGPPMSRQAGSPLRNGPQLAALQPSLQWPAIPMLRAEPIQPVTRTYAAQGQFGYATPAAAASNPAGSTDVVNAPMGYGQFQQPPAAPLLPRPDIRYAAPRATASRDVRVPTRSIGLPSTPRTPLTPAQFPGGGGARFPVGSASQLTPPAPAALSSPSSLLSTSGHTPLSATRTNIGLGMLRLSVDSIIDPYGGTTDTGYRYGGARGGEPGRI